MIIGIDASRANLEHKTGTEWYSFYVIQELKKSIPAEHTVRLYSKEPLRGALADLPPSWESRVLKWRIGALWTQLRLSCEQLLHRVDVLYVSAHTLPLFGGKKNVAVIHDVGFLRNTALYDTADVTRGGSSLMKRVLRVCVRIATLGRYSASERDYHVFAFRLAIKKAAAIITISQFSFDEICAVSPDPSVRERMHVIHNGFVRRGVPHDAIARVQALGIQRPYILTIGRVEEKKNMMRCVESIAHMLDRTQWNGDLVCVGAPGFGFANIAERVKDLGIAQRVHFLGWQDEEDVAALLSQAALFYFPTLYEGFGMPVIEALDSGVPVVCSNIPSLKEIAGESVVYCDPADASAMAAALCETIQQLPFPRERIEAGKRVAQQYQWSTVAERTWSIISHL